MLEKGFNSYLDIAEADELIAGVDTSNTWKGLPIETKEQCLITAAIHIDSLMLSSRKHSEEQTLQFPRGRSTVVPRAVLLAQALEALTLSDEQTMQRTVLMEQGVTSIRLGNTSESYSDNAAEKARSGSQTLTSKIALNLMRPYLLGSAVIV